MGGFALLDRGRYDKSTEERGYAANKYGDKKNKEGLQRDHQDQVAGLHLQVHHLRHLWRLRIWHVGRHRASLRPEDTPRRYWRLRPLEAPSAEARLHSFFGLRSAASQCPHAPRL